MAPLVSLHRKLTQTMFLLELTCGSKQSWLEEIQPLALRSCLMSTSRVDLRPALFQSCYLCLYRPNKMPIIMTVECAKEECFYCAGEKAEVEKYWWRDNI